jgi:lysophospholipase L1-like esterase
MSKCRPTGAARPAYRLAALLLLLAATAAHARAQTGNDPCPREYEPPDKDPIVMYVFGDSIMWGEGLAERNKFSCRVRNWLERKTGRRVTYRLFAHAGATVERDDINDPDHFGPWWTERAGGIGEINVSYPTINEQLDYAAARFAPERGEVDLVLVNGCANDVNFRNMLDARNTPEIIRGLARCKCDEAMKKLLRRIGGDFPRARIFVTGYYPLVFKGRTVEEGVEKKIPGTAYNLLTKTAIGQLVEDLPEAAGCENDVPARVEEVPADRKGKENFRRHLELLSQTWYDTSNELLERATEAADAGGDGPRRAYFVQLNLPLEFAFSTAHSMLWNFRFNSTGLRGLPKTLVVLLEGIRTFDPNDERQGERERVCAEAVRKLRESHRLKKAVYERKEKGYKAGGLDAAERAELTTDKNDLEKFKKFADSFRRPCNYGSLGHPNHYGAALYAQAITSQLQMILPETGWRKADGARPGEDPGRR